MPSDIEQHHGDDELSTLSDTHFLDLDDDFFFDSDEEETKKAQEKKKAN